MEFACYVIVLLLSRAVVTSGSPAPTVQHATSSQSFIIHQQPATSSVSSSTSYGGSAAAISGRANEPKYEYKYEVSDHATGDRKSHWETREGDKVRGVYTLYEPDGALRRVEYTADSLHGFNAIVTRNGQTKHFPPTTPSPLYTGANLIPTGYDKPGRQGFGPEPLIPRQGPTRYSSGPPLNQGLGFSVDHSAGKLNYPGVKRTDVIVPPY